MWQWLRNWLDSLEQLSWGEKLLLGIGLFLVMFAGSLAMVTWVLIQLPVNYFQDQHPPPMIAWAERHPVGRWIFRIGKNVLGSLLIAAGIVLSVPGVPGQGLLTILIGLMLVDFPGKRYLEKKLISWPSVLHAVNRLRARFGRQPLTLDPPSQKGGG